MISKTKVEPNDVLFEEEKGEGKKKHGQIQLKLKLQMFKEAYK